jgi:tetratricopeptide (TPR) repeat protein
LTEVERHLTEAAYFTYGPEVDEERALEAYDAALSRDSVNLIALNNASLIYARRRENERAAAYRLKAAAQDRTPNPVTWGNAVLALAGLGRTSSTDSLLRLWAERTPGQPTLLLAQARAAAIVGIDSGGGERQYREILPKVASSRTVTDRAIGDLAELVLLKGHIGEALRMLGEVNQRLAERGQRVEVLQGGIDSALATALVKEQPATGRALLHEVLRRLPPDSFAMAERPYESVLWAATFSGDVALAQQARGDFQRVLVAHGKTVDRPATESLSDGLVSLAAGRFEEVLTKINEADRLNHPCTECVAALRFIAQDKLNRPDSAIATGEAFLKVRRAGPSFSSNEALFRPAVLQRLGELYEAKGQSDKALTRYQAFVDLWHGADPDLQPRVRDVRSRIARLQAAAAKKG